MSGFIELSRDAGPRRDSLVPYDVVIDGETVALLNAGGSHSFPVEAGTHTVELRLEWTRSPLLDVDVPPGGTVRLRCGPAGETGRARTSIGRLIAGAATLYRGFVRYGHYIELREDDQTCEAGSGETLSPSSSGWLGTPPVVYARSTGAWFSDSLLPAARHPRESHLGGRWPSRTIAHAHLAAPAGRT